MKPMRIYKLADGTTRQYREGEQPEGSVVVEVAGKQTPESRAAKAPARRRAAKKAE